VGFFPGSAWHRLWGTAVLLCLALLHAPAAQAEKPEAVMPGQAQSGEEHDAPLPEAVEDALAHLLTLPGDANAPLDRERIGPLLDFVMSGRMTAASPRERRDGTGVYHSFPVRLPLARVMEYGYNPDLPSYAIMPRSVRFNGWVRGSMPKALWERLNTNATVTARGVEYEETTPDQFSGTYYGYELDRLLVLLQHKGRDMLLSVSTMPKTSSVGMKGAVVGRDENFLFFYSGRPGTTMRGLGWADPYIYEAASVFLLMEPSPGAGTTRVHLFKWLRGGWAGMNMVRAKHVRAGVERFAQGLRTILESPLLPPARELAAYLEELRSLPEYRLRTRLMPLAHALEEAAEEGHPVLSRDEFQGVLQNGAYVHILTPEQMESELLKARVRQAVLRPVLENAGN
jgi:hypothetical protein